MGIFNRGITNANRVIIAGELAQLLGGNEPVSESFEGIPIINNQRSWFFGYQKKRQSDDIDVLWNVFAEAIRFADSDDAGAEIAFTAAIINLGRSLNINRLQEQCEIFFKIFSASIADLV